MIQSNSYKVGSVEVSERWFQLCLIGFEENGDYVGKKIKYEMVYDFALMLDLASGNSLSDEILISTSFTTKDKVSCSPENVPKLISTLKEEFKF